MNEVSVAKLEKGAWDPSVLEAVEMLVAPAQKQRGTVLEDELLRCDTIYLATDADGPLAFLLVARVRLLVGAEFRPARYVGLGGVRTDRGGSEAAAAVYARFTADARLEEQERGARLVLFTTTATSRSPRTAQPLWTQGLWTDVRPAQDCSFPEGLPAVARAAGLWLGTVPCAVHDRPLLLCFLSEPLSSDQADAA